MKNHLQFTFERMKMMPGFDGKECKVYPRLIKTEKGMFLSYTMLLLSGSDVFRDSFFVKSTDGGKTFGQPEKLHSLETRANGIRTNLSIATEYYSQYHKKWFVFGINESYANDNHPIMVGEIATGEAGYILRDAETGRYTGNVSPIPMPFACISSVPHAQVVEYENGDFLLTFSVVPKDEFKTKALAVRYRYHDGALSIVAVGDALAYPNARRGIGEPSVAKLGERYYMTLRSDEQGLLSVSEDGLHYGAPNPWKWDDGSILENYNTMQRWIRHKDGLFLAYTRRGAHNDHVFRHRAPIFMARFDEENLCLVRDSEVILVPELGARLGNFTVTEISENEIWLATAEWMQSWGEDLNVCAKYGSDNSIWFAKIRFV